MIMLGTAPRALTWTGFLGVLGMGAMLLPLLPTWAQAPRSEPPQEEQEQGDQKEQEKQQLQAEMQRAQAEMESARQRMEQVRRRIQELEGRDAGRGRAAERGAPRPRQAESIEITCAVFRCRRAEDLKRVPGFPLCRRAWVAPLNAAPQVG